MARWFLDRSPSRGIPSVRLRRLLPDARFVGARDWEVSGCTTEACRLEPGQVFVAIPGHDGEASVGLALERGAAGVVVERDCPEAGPLRAIVDDARAAHAAICQALAGSPSGRLQVVGVTGASGKTATGLYIRAIFEAAGIRVGGIGASGWTDGLHARPPGATPPDAPTLAAMLAATLERDAAGAIVEASAETLESRAFDGVELGAGVVTAVGGRSAEERVRRRRAKARLFKRIAPGGAAVVNADDPDAELLGAVNLDARRVSYGIDRPADVSAAVDRVDRRGTSIRLFGFDREASVHLHPIGGDHVNHALAAAALGRALGFDLDAVVAGLQSVDRIPGRLEPVREGQDFDVRVDRARTGAELRRALATLRAGGASRLICVLGAEGDTDRAARLDLADAAEAESDQAILTLDNPRSTDPDQIFDDLLAGFRRPGLARVEPDRRRAIEQALSIARPGDAVLIAGKGRRSVQILADRVIPFDDAAVAAQLLRCRLAPPRLASA